MEKIKFDNYLQIEILRLLVNTNLPMSGYSLGSKLKVSSQSIRRAIRQINQILKPYDLSVKSLSGVGFAFEISGHLHEKRLKESIFEKLAYDKKITPNKFLREQLIIRYLVMTGTMVPPNELMDYFFVARTTLFRDLKRAQETMLNSYNLKLKVLPYQGIIIEGTEVSRRMILAREFSFYQEDSLLFELCDELVVEPINAQLLFDFIQNKLGYFVSNNELHSLYIHLYIMLARVKLGFIMDEKMLNTKTRVSVFEIELLQEFLVENNFLGELPLIEAQYYILLVKGLGRNYKLSLSMDSVFMSNVKRGIKDLEDIFSLDFSVIDESEEFYQEVDSLLIRTRNGFVSSNLNDKLIKKQSPFYLEIAFQFINSLKKSYNLVVSELDYCSIALSFYNLININNQLPKRKALVICSYSEVNSKRLLTSLKEGFPTINFLYENNFSLDKQVYQKYFFVLSDTYFWLEDTEFPMLKINHFITGNDHQNITDLYRKKRALLFEKAYAERKLISLKSKEEFFRYILIDIDHQQAEKKLKALLRREEHFTFEVKENIAVIYLWDVKIDSNIFEFSKPIHWYYGKVKFVYVINIHTQDIMLLNEWDVFYQEQ